VLSGKDYLATIIEHFSFSECWKLWLRIVCQKLLRLISVQIIFIASWKRWLRILYQQLFQLKRWRLNFSVEDSLLDSHMREILASLDTSTDAIMKIKTFLDEAWIDLGHSFLLIVPFMHAKVNQEGGLFC